MKVFYFLYFLFLPFNVYAYLDPGTGSLLLYALVGIVTSILYLFKGLFYKIVTLFLGKTNINKSQNKVYDIVIYTEGSRYYDVFKPLVDIFLNNKHPITIITQDKEDNFFSITDSNLQVIYPGNEYATFNLLNNLHANILISTTPNLNVYIWKKSKNVKKYIHIFHSPTSIDFYEKYSLSYYDVVFSCVSTTESAQQFLDTKRNLHKKEFYNVGCLYYDVLVQKIDKIKRNSNKRTILYAPSWGIRSSLPSFGNELISQLLSLGFSVIFRPHPQSFISDKSILEFVLNKYKQNENFICDNSKSPLQSMVESDLLITDFSGILFDYYFLINKPILLASDSIKKFGYEIEEIPYEYQFDIPYSEKFSTRIDKFNIKEQLDSIFTTQTTSSLDSKETSSRFLNHSDIISNFGCAAEKAYEIIMNISKEIKNV